MALVVSLLPQCCQQLYITALSYPILFYLIILLSFLIVLLKLTTSGRNLMNLPPAPPKLPIIGHLYILGTLPHHSLRALSDKYGPLMLLHLGRSPTLVVTSAELARDIMNTHDTLFANRIQTRALQTFFYGCKDVAFSQYGEHWRRARKICVLELLSLKSVQSFQYVMEEEVALLVEKIRSACLDRASVNIGEMMFNVSCNVISKCVLGKKCEGEESRRRFRELTEMSMKLMGTFPFWMGEFVPLLGWMDVLTGLVKNLKNTSQGFDAFLDEIIGKYQSSESDDCRVESKKCFLEILLHLRKEGILDFSVTKDTLKAILLDMFMGGIDTIANTMEWGMAELIKHPAMMKKTQEEIRRVVGKKLVVEEQDISRMDYLKCVIKETLRLHAPVPFLVPRESPERSVKLRGYDIPPKTRVFINAWAIQRDPKLWDKPEEFIPERFTNSPVDFKRQDFHLIPFGRGRRGCPGMSFGLVEVEIVVANLLYWFNWEFTDGETVEEMDMSEVYGVVIHKKVPLQLVPVLHLTNDL